MAPKVDYFVLETSISINTARTLAFFGKTEDGENYTGYPLESFGGGPVIDEEYKETARFHSVDSEGEKKEVLTIYGNKQRPTRKLTSLDAFQRSFPLTHTYKIDGDLVKKINELSEAL